MTPERLDEIRQHWSDRWEFERNGWRPVNLRWAQEDCSDLLAHIDAQQERIDALEAERAEEWAMREAGGWVWRCKDRANAQDSIQRPGDEVVRRFVTPWLPVQEDDRG